MRQTVAATYPAAKDAARVVAEGLEAAMVEVLAEETSLLEGSGPWCTVYVDASAGTVDTIEAGAVRAGNLSAALEAAGATAADTAAVLEAASGAVGERAPVSRYVLVRGGRVQLNELLEGQLAVPELVEVGVIPDLVPLLKHQAVGFAYVVAQVGRADAVVELHPAGGGEPVSQEIVGSTETLKKVAGGGWAQYNYQHRTEEVWRQNARLTADAIDALVYRESPRLVLLAGDVKACSMVEEALSAASQKLLVVIHSHTHTSGADPERTGTAVQARVAEDEALEVEEVLASLTEQVGRGRAALGIEDTVAALALGQVDTLVLDDEALAGRRLYAFGAAPWVSSLPAASPEAGMLGEVKAPAALVRAAVLTRARVVFLPRTVLPQGAPVAGLLRWSPSPTAP